VSAPAFVMDFGWRVWHPSPARPRFIPPPGAVDAHCHVFGPGDVFPYAPSRKYTPCDRRQDDLFALRHFPGLERDVPTVKRDVTPDELRQLHEGGVRGVRFNFVRRLVDALPHDELREIAAKIAPLGWHIVIYFEAAELADLQDFFLALPAPLVVDHMGTPRVDDGADGPLFDRFLAFMAARDDIWCKVSCPERLSKEGPPAYADVVPFGWRVVEAFPDRVLWGTDWPHPNMKTHTPDEGQLVDFIPTIATTPELQRRLLVDNPMRLYWPEETGA